MLQIRKRFLIYLLIFVLVLFIENRVLEHRKEIILLNTVLKEKEITVPRVYMLLIDAADPQIVDNLTKRGYLPNFQRLQEEGVRSRTTAFPINEKIHFQRKLMVNKSKEIYQNIDFMMVGIYSLPIIATIFTGKSPAEHKMVTHLFLPNDLNFYYPFRNMPVPAIWNMVSINNRSVGVVGTLGNYPVDDRVKGFIISCEFIIKRIIQPELGFLQQLWAVVVFPDHKLLYPSVIISDSDMVYRELPVISKTFQQQQFPIDFPKGTEKAHVEKYEEVLLAYPKKIAMRLAKDFLQSNKTAYYTYLMDLYTLELSKYTYQKYKPAFFLVYTQGLDFYTNMWYNKNYTDYSDLNSTIFKYYKIYDEYIGYLMDNLDNNTILIVMSDHGALQYDYIMIPPYYWKYENGTMYAFLARREHGIFYAYGKSIKSDISIPDLSVYDITPTVLYLMDLPVGKDMKGKVRTDLLKDGYLNTKRIYYINTYD